MTALARYDAACAALAEAVQADEVMTVRLEAKAIEAVARVAKNLDLEVQAAQLRIRAEARLGVMLREGEEQGIIARRGRQPNHAKGSDEEPLTRATLKDIGVDKKLSAQAKRLADIGPGLDGLVSKLAEESRARGRLAFDVINQATAKRTAESRRQLAKELSDASVPLNPTGRRFPVLYADPAWQRKAGIGNRAYENHYATMTWPELLAMPVKDRLLPDAWGFVWIPRAHVLAMVECEIETPLGICTMNIPLAWAVMLKWGFDSYSTCFVWTKTDEEVPDDHGMGLITWDQDELLLLFKRGRGLPKPDTDAKFGSNYRARPGRHSEKPAFYRDMINAMTRGLPVLELFAREDDDHILPPNFYTWGNQSKNTANTAVSHETPAESEIEAERGAVTSVSLPEDDSVQPTAANVTPVGEVASTEPATVSASCAGSAGSPVETSKCAICGGSCKPTFCPNDPALEIPKFLKRTTEGKTAAA